MRILILEIWQKVFVLFYTARHLAVDFKARPVQKNLIGSLREISLCLRRKTGLLKWHLHKSRSITRSLFRLRTGHNYLAANRSRFFLNEDPSCRDCGEEESPKHVLFDCPALELERVDLRKPLDKYGLVCNLENVLGLNPSLPAPIQFEIQSSLVRYLKETGLLRRI